jgi:hypothetical protein
VQQLPFRREAIAHKDRCFMSFKGEWGTGDEKIVREVLIFRRVGGRKLVEKAKQAGALLGGREPSCLGLKTLRVAERYSERGTGRKAERGAIRGRGFSSELSRGRAWEVKRPKRAEGSALV